MAGLPDAALHHDPELQEREPARPCKSMKPKGVRRSRLAAAQKATGGGAEIALALGEEKRAGAKLAPFFLQMIRDP
jgi:hypothetical protein